MIKENRKQQKLKVTKIGMILVFVASIVAIIIILNKGKDMKNEDHANDIYFEDLITNFCSRIEPDFEELVINLNKLDKTLNSVELAKQLMEFGRGQISEIDEPTETDLSFINRHSENLNYENEKAAHFQAYASGCLMGLLLSNQLESHMLIPAMEISALFALKKYAPNKLTRNKKPNALLELTNLTVWEDLKRKSKKENS